VKNAGANFTQFYHDWFNVQTIGFQGDRLFLRSGADWIGQKWSSYSGLKVWLWLQSLNVGFINYNACQLVD
jgi:hypothetical protein